MDYEKAFDSVEHFAIFETLLKIGVHPTYIKILQNIYRDATARVHLDKHTSEPFPIERGVRQGDPISPKLFTAAIEEVFQKSNLQCGIEIEGENLTDLRFADDVALCTKDLQTLESHLNTLNSESMKIGLKMHKGKTKYMTNYSSQGSIKIEENEIEEVPEYKYLGQTLSSTDTIDLEIATRIRSAWRCFGKYREIFLDNSMPMCLKKKVFEQCLIPTLTYGCETWPLKINTLHKIRSTQRAMERKILGISLLDKINHTAIREKTKFKDVVSYTLNMKWKWAGHVGRMKDNRWTIKCTRWAPQGKRKRGRPRRRWADDLSKYKSNWLDLTAHREEWKELAEGYILLSMHK